MSKKINLSDEPLVRSKIMSGVTKMADMCGMTLGPDGRSVIIERGVGEPLIVDDGRRVAENIKLDDPVEQLAVRTLYGVTKKTDEKVGDGTTTATLLSYGIMRETMTNRLATGDTLVGNNKSVSEIDREIMAAKELVLKKLDEMKVEVKTEKELIDVARVSVGDSVLGEIIGKMFWKLGKDGHITMEYNLLSEKIETEIVDGFRFNGGWAERFMITNALRQESVMLDSYLLITNKMDLEVNQVKGICSEVQNAGKSGMTIIAPKFTPDFLKSVFLTAQKSGFAILCIKTPSLHEEHYRDLAIWSGGKFFTTKDDLNIAIKSDLGYCDKVEVTDDSAHLINGRGDKELIKKRIEEVKAEMNDQKVHALKSLRLERISSLSGGAGLIKIGAPTDEERNWLKHKIEDAKYATKHAFREGIVPGGGMAFKKISDELPEGNILKSALLVPYERLKANAGGKFVVPKNVVDPVAVEKSALENACSAVSKLIRIGGAIATAPEPTLDKAFKNVINNSKPQDDEDGE